MNKNQANTNGCGLSQVLLLTCGGSLFNFIPVLAVAFFLIIRQWISAVYTLARIHDPTPEEQASMAQGLDQANSPSSLSKVDLSCPVVPKTAVDLELEANIVHTWDVAPADLDKNDIVDTK